MLCLYLRKAARKCLGTVDNRRLRFFKEVTKKINEGSVVDFVFVDFSCALDKVLHGQLVY